MEKENKPLISVIVPVYNCGAYLPQCIESILAQTYKNLQIILIDDGATDNSGKICDDYAKKDTRIEVIHQKNAGVSQARNAGLKIAKGKYIGFVDGDDYISPGMYDYLYALNKEYNTAMSFCNFYILTEISEEQKPLIPSNSVLTANEALSLSVQQLFIWNKLFSADLFKGLAFPKDISYGEDMFILLELFKRAGKIAYGIQPCCYYRQYIGSATRGQSWHPKHLGWLAAADKVLSYAREQQLNEVIKVLKNSQINLAVSFLRDSLIKGPYDEESIKKLKKYFSRNLFAFLCSDIKLSKKAFVLCAFINLKLAKNIYRKIK